jgi:tetratricopeptide (TPR) repeat protein
MTLTALAGLLRDEGRYREAEQLYRRALDIREKFAAGNPGEIAETLRDYAVLLQRSGRGAEAAPLTARATQLTPAK